MKGSILYPIIVILIAVAFLSYFYLMPKFQYELNAVTASHEINGRDEGNPQLREPIYRLKAPTGWIRTDPPIDESISDSKKPLCEFCVEEGVEKIRITIHNFPTESLEERIPPLAQIVRWKRQFDYLNPTDVSISPQSYAGFLGQLFMASGEQKGQTVTVMGWSMQLGQEHYRHLSALESSDKMRKQRQMRADYTIKVVGPAGLVKKHHTELVAFANSFELIEEIPQRY
jgi:hypothetical protein